MNIIFFGTPDFAVPFLEMLFNDTEIKIQGVITQTDKKVGREKLITPPPVKVKAQELNLTVLQPEKLKNNNELKKLLQDLKPDFFVVIAYGKLLPKEYIEIPKYGAVNIHASMLPKYRGASPIQSALLNGDQETGITVMDMEEKLDTGDIYLIKKDSIKDEDNYITLSKRLSVIGALLLPAALKDIKNLILTPIPQNEQKATYCAKIEKEDALIDPQTEKAEIILNKLRAFTPWPGIFMILNNKRMKIVNASLYKHDLKIKPGEFKDENKTLLLGCAEGILRIDSIQPEGKKVLNAGEFINGFLR